MRERHLRLAPASTAIHSFITLPPPESKGCPTPDAESCSTRSFDNFTTS